MPVRAPPPGPSGPSWGLLDPSWGGLLGRLGALLGLSSGGSFSTWGYHLSFPQILLPDVWNGATLTRVEGGPFATSLVPDLQWRS